jgi:hypothetical protein
LCGYNDIGRNIKTFDTRGWAIYQPNTGSNFKLQSDFFFGKHSFIQSFINKVTDLYIQGPDLCRETLQIDHVLRKVY